MASQMTCFNFYYYLSYSLNSGQSLSACPQLQEGQESWRASELFFMRSWLQATLELKLIKKKSTELVQTGLTGKTKQNQIYLTQMKISDSKLLLIYVYTIDRSIYWMDYMDYTVCVFCSLLTVTSSFIHSWMDHTISIPSFIHYRSHHLFANLFFVHSWFMHPFLCSFIRIHHQGLNQSQTDKLARPVYWRILGYCKFIGSSVYVGR